MNIGHLDIDPPDWHVDALCAQTDPDAFFPEKGLHGKSVRQVKRVCNACPAQIACLSHAVENNERFGIWGGFTERERRAFARDPRKLADFTRDHQEGAA